MAKCKRCKKNIPDGVEYCNDCLDKEKAKSNESYLDSLLNSVKNTAPATEKIYKKKSSDSNSADSVLTSDNLFDTASDEDDIFNFDLGDIEDFDQFNLEDDLAELYEDTEFDKEKPISEPLGSLSNQEVTMQNKLLEESVKTAEHTDEQDLEHNNQNGLKQPLAKSDIPAEHNHENMENGLNEEDDYDSALNDLLNSLDTLPNDQEDSKSDIKNIENDNTSAQQKKDAQQEKQLFEDQEPKVQEIDENDEDDFLSLLNQISSDDPVAEDVKAINDLIHGNGLEPDNNSNIPSDVGEVFSDALKAVSNLNDSETDIDDLLSKVSDNIKDNKKKNKKKSKTSKQKGKKKRGEVQEDQVAEKPKKGFLKRLFGNVEDNKNKPKAKITSATSEENIEVTGKSAKKKKAKNKKDAAQEDETLSKDKKSKPDKKIAKKNSKKNKKEGKVKTTEVIQIIDEIDEDVGRINRLGASIVFIFFGLLVLLLYAGTNAITYALSIQHASTYFSIKEYTKAYNEVYGMEIKPEDLELYEKIQTVMFVNKQLNSYNNYYSIGEYPEALDSLLKGLERYDKYIELADMLGIKTDMDYVRKQLLAELKKEFGISQKEAKKINSINNMKDYSLKVYEIAKQVEMEIKSLSEGM